MTTTAYPSQLQAFKRMSSRDWIGRWEVIDHDGDLSRFENYVEAIIHAHDNNGRLYQVVKDTKAPNGFRRVQKELPAADLVEDLRRRTPKKEAAGRWNTPIYGR